MAPSPLSLRVLVCDPQKNSRQQLCRLLANHSLAAEIIPARSIGKLMESLYAKKINVLFIDPLAFDLVETSNLIFQIRERFPHVLICLFVHLAEVRRRSAEFYQGEREHFGHYFTLDKDLTATHFDGAVLQLVCHCSEALRRWQLRPGRIELIVPSRWLTAGSPPPRPVRAATPIPRQQYSHIAEIRPLPMKALISSLPASFKTVARFFSRI